MIITKGTREIRFEVAFQLLMDTHRRKILKDDLRHAHHEIVYRIHLIILSQDQDTKDKTLSAMRILNDKLRN